MRKTWDGDCGKLGWDQALPEELVQEMIDFFLELFDLENVVFPRSLVPEGDVDGKPDLDIFSDGSVKHMDQFLTSGGSLLEEITGPH